MFDKIREGIGKVINYISGQTVITEYNISTTVKELKKALLSADVNYNVAKDFVEGVKKKALKQRVAKGMSPSQFFLKIIYDQLVELLGKDTAELNLNKKPSTIMVCGLQGSGKTTFCVKLAYFLQKRGKTTILVSTDVHRPAAREQLKILAQSENFILYDKESTDPFEITRGALEHARIHGFDALIIDTAGRQVIDEEMMREAEKIKEIADPTETLLVVDAMTGQEAVTVATNFDKRLNIPGVILSKMDGDAKGGAALSIKYTTGKPIKFLSTGEKIYQIELFNPQGIASRILGFGDILTTIQKAQQLIDTSRIQENLKKIKEKKYTMDDFLKTIEELEDTDKIKEILRTFPGLGHQIENIPLDPKAIKRMKAVIQSMTPQERNDPSILNISRKQRIAQGSGTSLETVNATIKFYNQYREMMKIASTPTGLLRIIKQLGL